MILDTLGHYFIFMNKLINDSGPFGSLFYFYEQVHKNKIEYYIIIIMNSNNMNLLSCSFCEKEFHNRKKTLYDRHIILCEVVHNSNKNKEDEDEEIVPSNKQMYKIIKELSIQNNKLKEKINELEKIIQRGGMMKKVDILEKLNSNPVKPDCLFKEWIKNIVIEEEDIDNLITENIANVINTILSRNIDVDEYSPIISSDIKKTNIYIFTITEDEIKWIKMENDDFLLLIKTLYKYLLTAYQTQWKEKNQHIHHYDEINVKLLHKITNLKTDNFADTTNRKIWNSLYLLVSKII